MLELATLIPRHARFRPDATAVVFENERLTYAQFGARVARSANLLRSLGIGKGDKVATVLGNSREALELVWAVAAVGAALVPLSPLLLPAGLASLLRGSDAKCLVSQRSMLPVLEAIRADLAPLLPGRVLLIDGAAGDFGDYGALTAAQAATFVPEPCGPDDLFNIMYTSGTTGLPKGIMHTHFVRSMYCLLMASACRMTPESRTLHTGAIVFNGAFVTLMPTLYLGARLRPAAAVRRRRGDRHDRARARHAHHAGADADHRDPRRERTGQSGSPRSSDPFARCAAAAGAQGQPERAPAAPLLRALRPAPRAS